MVLITSNIDSHLKCKVDLSSDEWKSLNTDNLSPFKMEEKRCLCSAYPDGIFPGAEKSGDKQISKIQHFTNFIEYSKVVSDDTVFIQGKTYLTTRFYDQRKIGWASQDIIKKKGNVIGYCLDGDVYCSEDRDKVYKIFYEVVYYSIIKNFPTFISLKKLFDDGVTLELSGASSECIEWLSKILIAS